MSAEAPPLFLSVVIPAYNEADNIARGALEQVLGYLTRQPYATELLVVDDGSEDDDGSIPRRGSHGCPGPRLLEARVEEVDSQSDGQQERVEVRILRASGADGDRVQA